jgi:hypothetical protein
MSHLHLRWNQFTNPMEWGWIEYEISVIKMELEWKTIKLNWNG